MTLPRRSLLLAAAALPLVASLGGCAVSFAKIQGYVAEIGAFVDKIGPLVAKLVPAQAATIANLTAQIDAAVKAFSALTAPPSGASIAQTIVSAVSDLLTIALSIPALPPQYALIIGEVQVLLLAVAAFFNIAPPASLRRTGASLESLSAGDREKRADLAAAKVRAFLAAN